MKGRLHSIESFGAVDGPGIRTVFFMQGCPARCWYCHNPDTWKETEGRNVELDEILFRAKRGVPYYGNDGGVTFSGGEPLLQGEFLLEAINALKEIGIESAIDTSGTYIDEHTEKVIDAAALVLLDIKYVEPKRFKTITGCDQDTLFKIIDIINRLDKHVWIRQVIMPGVNDTPEYIDQLNDFIKQINNVDKVELLGYHNMAKNKYEKLGMNYRLKNMKPMNKDALAELQALVEIK